ncbi:MAG: hypothetical protein KatS3mg044_1088 [Rhodothermaceae bacterium]|nr:MAG: hypothetical protein KatS3mg044_1088 [Rhodothermaceae bacterium]
MRVLKWTGIVLGGLAGLLLLFGAFVYVAGGMKFNRTYTFAESPLPVRADSATRARGAHLVRTHACAECHGPDLGGKVLVDGMPFARIVAANLTAGRGGIGTGYRDADWERALRHGVNPQGRGLLIMPADLYTHLADDELGAMIAYLKTLPPVDNELPATELGLVGRMVATFNPLTMPELMTSPAGRPATAPPMGPTTAYGQYRTRTLCIACHGADLHGAPPPGPRRAVRPRPRRGPGLDPGTVRHGPAWRRHAGRAHPRSPLDALAPLFASVR